MGIWIPTISLPPIFRPSWPILTRRILYWGQMRSFAVVKGVNLSFLNAMRVLCAKHLKDNAIVNLGKSLPQPEVTKIISKLSGESGILASEDQVTFDEIRDDMTSPTCLTGCFPTWSSSLSSLGYDTPVCLVYGTTTVTSRTTMLLSGIPTGLSRSCPT
jgi:hypothetical protein